MINRRQFAGRVLDRLGAPRSKNNLQALVAWMQTEGYGGRNNPLNTTLPMPGSTIFNSHGVRNYLTIADGVEATRRTLVNSDAEYGYRRVIRHLRRSAAPRATLEALLESSWGTTDLVLRVLDDVERTWPDLAVEDAARS